MNGLKTILDTLGNGPAASAFRTVGLLLLAWSVISGVLSLTVLFRQDKYAGVGRRTHLLTRAGEVLLIANLLLYVLATGLARARLVSAVFVAPSVHLDQSELAGTVAEALAASYNGLGFWAVTSLLGAVAYTLARLAGQKSRPTQPWLWLVLTLLSCVAYNAFQRIVPTEKAIGRSKGADPIMAAQWVSEALRETLVPVDDAFWLIVGTCLVFLVVWLRLARSEAAAFRMSLKGPVITFSIGLLLFAMTRDHRFDARHPLKAYSAPAYQPGVLSTEGMPERAALARAEAVQAPLLKIAAPGYGNVDGYAGNPEQIMDVMKHKHEIWDQLRPGVAFPGEVLLVIPAHLPMKDIDPWLAKLERLGFTRFYAVVRVPDEDSVSKTLGKVVRSDYCWMLRVPRMHGGAASWDEHITAASYIPAASAN